MPIATSTSPTLMVNVCLLIIAFDGSAYHSFTLIA